MENIPSTMVLHNHVYGVYNTYAIMMGTLVNNSLGGCLGLIIMWTYQEAYEDNMCLYEPVSDLFPDVEPDSDSSDDELSD